MVLFPNAKINIGLNVLQKRPDGFHNIETLFYPIQLCDILEINLSSSFQFFQSGIMIDGNQEKNLVVKAFRMMQQDFGLTDISIHLHKIIPFGAGLGGGSADAAFTILALNDLFHLNLEKQEMAQKAASLGSDCPFFIYNIPMMGTGKGDQLSDSKISLKGLTLVMIKPLIAVSTADAYSSVVPFVPAVSLDTVLQNKIDHWKTNIKNQFEGSVYKRYPEIGEIKAKLYDHGAVYASMSGSGSAVFGLFETDPGDLSNEFTDCFLWKEKCR